MSKMRASVAQVVAHDGPRRFHQRLAAPVKPIVGEHASIGHARSYDDWNSLADGLTPVLAARRGA